MDMEQLPCFCGHFTMFQITDNLSRRDTCRLKKNAHSRDFLWKFPCG